MSAVPFDFTIEAGATLPVIWFDYQDDAGDPVAGLTGWTAQFQIRKKARTATTLISTEPPFDDTLARVSLSLTAAQTGSLPAGVWVYAIELHSPGDEPVIRLVEGDVTVSAEVVR